ncbi:hypothetical protein MSG28_012360, partial [Choristoneura fumiferana]
MPLPPASGTGRYFAKAAKSIRLVRHGCTNRPFFHISVTHRKRTTTQPVIEQLGSFDPMPNAFNEKLVALNLERLKYWLGKGAHVTPPVGELLAINESEETNLAMALNPRSGRLAYEIKLFQTRPPWGVVCNFEKDDQCDMFLVTMRGPKGTPYEDGSFKLTITIPEKYPFEPPLVKFVTP